MDSNSLSEYKSNEDISVNPGNVFHFTQGRADSDNEYFDDNFYTSSAFKKIKELCLREPEKVFRVVIDQGYISDEDFQVRRRFYDANRIYNDVPGNLVIEYSGTKEAVDDGYVPRPFPDADKEWFKKFKASCEANPDVIHRITIDEGDMERGAFMDYVFTMCENLPDNARVMKNFNKAHDNTEALEGRFKQVDFSAYPISEELKRKIAERKAQSIEGKEPVGLYGDTIDGAKKMM